jgi:predicted ribonuclease YlaK
MYQSLLDGVGHLAGSQQERLVNGLVAFEVEERTAALEQAVYDFRQQMERWPTGVAYLVLDTSFYIQHPVKVEEVDFSEMLQSGTAEVRILVPMAVIDELDGLKQQKSGQARWRAGYTLAVLDERLHQGRGVLRAAQLSGDLISLELNGTGKVSVEILFDPADHVRLPIMDDEIVDRARAVQTIADGVVALVTYDTGQAMRARNAGLLVRKLRTDAGTGPEPAKG